ncbi:site-specific integrase [Paenibacillus apiarius]|uniref:Integrase n=1 Tax=Paenibacillus apiarius TaxID=46240 RepID=A0ABT4DP96_9BACL|nr:site-specific integrase [Paenibacillus apiarius]MCY9517230.1 integrase [Paenibacillus apiarius]MCY9519175.1 integrase [Paenibacillus apiarius]MCY9551042.1 integrase [Paenibacillus apiarius]MCY9560029.1 integrase [Paenibacillus apiarius]MCY9683328.1 integrase [Paenibacillus apiarius]
MANIVYENKFYNEEAKRRFMQAYAAGTQKIIARLFKVSQTIEHDLDKDLYDFNREQLRRLFYLYLPKTEYSSRANVTWISKYIDWAIEEGLACNLNPLDGVAQEWKEQFVIKGIKRYWTEHEIDTIILKCVNAQDAVIVSLLFNGVRGVANSELLNLKNEDVDVENKQLTLLDDKGNRRTIAVSEQCIDLCVKALRESEYEKKNGNPSIDIKAPTAWLVDNNYVIKSSHTRTEHFNEAEKNIIHRRLSNIAKEIKEPGFTPMNIRYSGMLAMANHLYAQFERFERSEYKRIAQQFNEESEQSGYRIRKEFLNLPTLQALYQWNEKQG